MRKVLIFLFLTFILNAATQAQCSICTKTAQQLGEKTGRGLNSAIIYLAAAPIAIVGLIGYRWWRNNSREDSE